MNLNQLTIKEAREGLKEKKFSSVELTKDCFEQIKITNPKINAYITVCENKAIDSAKKADELLSSEPNVVNDKPLLGIPISAKDLYSTEGIKTTAGSKLLENYIPQYNSTVYERLKNAGAVLVGKTNCDAWAHGSSGENSDFGPTKNPWNLDYVPGGSSSGSAAAVSSQTSLASMGTDTGGSIRLPASFCNVVGLKPTYGLVSRYGIIAMASSLDSIGHFTKTVEDSEIILSVTSGKDEKDATTSHNKYEFKKVKDNIKNLKIGIVKEYLKGIDSGVKKNVDESIKIFEKLGAKIEEISLPNSKYAIEAYYIIQPAEVSSNLARYDGIRFGSARQNFGDEAKRRIMLGTFTLSVGYYDAYYKKAMQIRTLIKKDFDEAFKKVDAIISPVSPTPPWKIGEKVNDPLKMYLSDIFTVTANLAGIPGISVPAGFANDLPTGIQILGPQFSENLLFQAGNAFEKETEFYKTKPNL